MNLETGAFGDPANPATLILFWQKMEMLHYPGAAETRAYLEEEAQRQEMLAQERERAALTMQMKMGQMEVQAEEAQARADAAADETAPRGTTPSADK